MFFIPFALGWLAAGRFSAAVILLLAASVAVFLARESVLFWWRMKRRGGATDGSGAALLLYGGVAASAGVPLVVVYGLPWLMPAALIATAALLATAELAVRRQGRAAATEFLAIATSAMNAATAWYAATGRLEAPAFLLWALSAAYFGSSVFYVKMRVRNAHSKSPEETRRARRDCALYHLGLLGALAASWYAGLSMWVFVGFWPVLIRAYAHLMSPTAKLNLQRVGWQEVVFSLFFLFAAAAGTR